MRERAMAFLQELREGIMHHFQTLEPTQRFERKPWQHHAGGGGEIGLLRGDCFEKAAVNFSAVHGDHFPLEGHTGPFFATGISLITHLQNPHAPTVHMNLRYIETQEQSWLGGGYDLTPMGFPYQEDTDHFHAVAKATLDPFGAHLYPQFSQNARDYFFIKHRKKERGVGGLFFDYYRTNDTEQDIRMWQQVGRTFLDAILPIYRRRISMPYTPEQRKQQLVSRAHYVEFNLLYDRGTAFGLRLGSNVEGVLCSMPPLAAW